MADAPAPPWELRCAWCSWTLIVSARGQRGRDEGSGVEAARRMADHVEREHGRTWSEFLNATRPT